MCKRLVNFLVEDPIGVIKMVIDGNRFLNPPEVASLIRDAIENHYPFSMVRIGDGEALTMAQETTLPLAEIETQVFFLKYAGITVPNLHARDELLNAVRSASLVGLPNRWDLPYFSPLVEKVFENHGINPTQTCNCCMNYFLHHDGYLIDLLKKGSVLLIGRRASELALTFEKSYPIRVAGQIPINSYEEVPLVLSGARRINFDIAFVSAGIPAVTICAKIATEFGKVALDMGHLADEFIKS